jgi:hypothetical protein
MPVIAVIPVEGLDCIAECIPVEGRDCIAVPGSDCIVEGRDCISE